MPWTATQRALCGLLCTLALPSHAAIITVNTTVDKLGGAGCSLREAILSANGDDQHGQCAPGSGADTILVPAGTYTLTFTGFDDFGFLGDLDIRSQVTILGADPAPGNGPVVVEIDAQDIDRVFHVHPGIEVEIRRLKVRNGLAASANGGGILNQGTLTVVDSIVESCTAAGSDGGQRSSGLGGGITNEGVLNLVQSLLSNNRAEGGDGTAGTAGGGGGGGGGGLGGGLFNAATGTATLTNVTFDGNTAVGGRGGNGTTCPGGVPPCRNGAGGTGGGLGGPSGVDGFPGGLGGGGGGGRASDFGGDGGDGGAGGLGGGGGGGGGAFGALGTSPGPAGGGGFGGGRGASGELVEGGEGGGGGGLGGGIANLGSLLLINSTLANNRSLGGSRGTSATANRGADGSGIGGGIYTTNGFATRISNSIVIGNSADSGGDCLSSFANFQSLGHNLFGASGGCTTTATGDQTTLDPLLGDLAQNGGATPTRALLNASPAIDSASTEAAGASPAACSATDQRGVARPQGTRCDRGAFEVGREDVTLSKSAPASVAAGSALVYTLTVSNPGGAAATNVTVTDPLPPGVTVVSTSPACSGTTTLSCPLGTINPGGSTTITLNLMVSPSNAAASLTNTASVTASPADLNTANNSAAATTALRREVDLALTKSASPAQVVAGNPLTYTLRIDNNGPSNANGVVLTDTLPSGISFVSSPGCTLVGSTVTCNIGTLAPSGFASRTIDVAVPATASGTLTNSATVTTSTTELNATNNTATLATTVVPRVDLTITKTDGLLMATPGESLTYTIQAINNGSHDALDAHVTDLFPTSLSCIWGCLGTGGALCRPGQVLGSIVNEPVNLPAGAVATFTAVCSIDSTATGTLSNTATVTAPATIFDPVSFNNSASDLDTVLVREGDLAITKSDGVTSAVPGQGLTYTVSATNSGPSQVTNARVTDALPAGLACTWTCVGSGSGNCTAAPPPGNLSDLVNLPVNAIVTYTGSCNLDPAATGTLANSATISPPPGTSDGNAANNTATDANTVLTPRADLAITKSDGVTTAIPGMSVTYTITASNPMGPSLVDGAAVTDAFPASLSCIWTCAGTGGATCRAGQTAGNVNDTPRLPVGGLATYTASCTIAPHASGTLANTAAIAAPPGVTDPNPANNTFSDLDTVLTPRADLTITKTDGVTSAAPGGTLTYTIVASNPTGPSEAANVTVADVFPSALTCNWGCVGLGGATCTPGQVPGNLVDTARLPVGGSARYTATCAIDSFASGSLANTATVAAAAGVDPNPGNNSASDLDTALVSQADLAITVTDGLTAAVPGQSLTYTLVATNAGPNNATATVTDTFPAGLSCSWGCLASAGGSCTAGQVVGAIADSVRLPASGTATYTAQCAIAGSATGTLSNTATITPASGVLDVAPGNNTASDLDTVLTPRADLVLTKSNAPTSVPRGGTLVYTLELENAGPSTATGVVITDTLPVGVVAAVFEPRTAGTGTLIFADGFESGDTSAWSLTVGSPTAPCSVSGNLATCTVGTLASGESRSYQLSVTVGFSASGTLINSASVAGNQTDPSLGNNSATAQATVITSPINLALTLTDAPDPTSPGGILTYTATITNAGPATATGVVFEDPLPPELALASVTSSQGTCTQTTQVSCQLGTLRPVDVATVTITTQVQGNVAGAVTNAASVVGQESELDFSDNTATAVTSITRRKETP